jgi:NaMN:DMB phosphoribosyltransferase
MRRPGHPPAEPPVTVLDRVGSAALGMLAGMAAGAQAWRA